MRLTHITLLFCLLATSGCATRTPTETQATVKELVTQTQALVDAIAARSAGSGLPPLKSAQITVSQQIKSSASGSVALVISGGGGQSRADTNSLTIVLVPNPESVRTSHDQN